MKKGPIPNLKFVNKISMPNHVKSLGWVKCYSSTSSIKNECSNSYMLLYACDCVQSIILLPWIVGASFALVALTILNVSEPKHWVTRPHRTGINFQFLRGKTPVLWSFWLTTSFLLQFLLWCKLHLKNSKFLFTWNHTFKPDHQTGLPDTKNCKLISGQPMKQNIFSLKCMILVQEVYIIVTNNLHEMFFSLTAKRKMFVEHLWLIIHITKHFQAGPQNKLCFIIFVGHLWLIIYTTKHFQARPQNKKYVSFKHLIILWQQSVWNHVFKPDHWIKTFVVYLVWLITCTECFQAQSQNKKYFSFKQWWLLWRKSVQKHVFKPACLCKTQVMSSGFMHSFM